MHLFNEDDEENTPEYDSGTNLYLNHLYSERDQDEVPKEDFKLEDNFLEELQEVQQNYVTQNLPSNIKIINPKDYDVVLSVIEEENEVQSEVIRNNENLKEHHKIDVIKDKSN